MSRQDRLLQKHRAKLAKDNQQSGLVREQVEEENAVCANLVKYCEKTIKPLVYLLDGIEHTVSATTDDGKPMTYHDQHYQITRLKNGLPIEAKRIQDYTFKYEDAEDVEADVSLSAVMEEDAVESEEYKNMKAAHEAQHPTED